MKAIGYAKAGPISDPNALVEFECDVPEPGPHDLLVEVHGVSMNPVDVKVRANQPPQDNAPRILGFDAAGVVVSVGAEVTRFKPGDEVYYAGDLMRPGSNAEFQCVDERIVGRKPQSLDFAEAAGIPLTAITAWEILFDSFGLRELGGEGEELLVIGGAGGVGSILIQLAKKLTGLTVIASASRDETVSWVKALGADAVVNHRHPLDKELAKHDFAPRYVAALTNTEHHFSTIGELIKPRGCIAVIDDPSTLDIKPWKQKALSVAWEFMFTRSMFQTEDLIVQHTLLNRVSDLLDQGELSSTVRRNEGPMRIETLRRAHAFQESGEAIGKTVLGAISG
ncbi:MAG: zinc-binding alcohol dehydrogenase family protein [Myxococcota bacterium]